MKYFLSYKFGSRSQFQWASEHKRGLSTWPSSIPASPSPPCSIVLSAFLCSCLCHWLGFSWSFCMWLLFSPPSLFLPFLPAFLVFWFWYEFCGHSAGVLVGMRKPVALVLNKAQKLDVGTPIVEKAYLHLSVHLAFKVAVKYWAQIMTFS